MPTTSERAHPMRSMVMVVAVLLLVTVACGSAGSRADDGKLQVQASFYPLAWLAEQVGGDLVNVSDLTPPGVEPHDLELTPREVASVSDADLVAYIEGFQPAVDDLVAQDIAPVTFDASVAADGGDPHFWLDPIRLAQAGTDLAETLSTLDPANEAAYRANAVKLESTLAVLDQTMKDGLSDCADTALVTSHEAFGHLAQRYGFEQVGISGLSPEVEPTPDELAAAVDFVEENDVATIYFETLVSPSIAEVVAAETGAQTAVLDPIEGLTDASAGNDYLEIMEANLAVLVKGQSCS